MTIYKITNRINGKVYIGQTKNNSQKRWQMHCGMVNNRWAYGKLLKAIKEFGKENFTVEVIDYAATKEEANAKEIYWIKHYNATEEGYNTAIGGKGGGHYRKVMCVETGQVFNTMGEAAKIVGVTTNAIWQAVKNPTWKCAGYHWADAKIE